MPRRDVVVGEEGALCDLVVAHLRELGGRARGRGEVVLICVRDLAAALRDRDGGDYVRILLARVERVDVLLGQ